MLTGLEGVEMEMDAPVLPLRSEFVQAFAAEWIGAWNSHDLERIVGHYEEGVELRSPVALRLLGGDGRVQGKEGLREYFALGLKAYPDLRFELVEALWGIETIVLSYVNNVRGSKTAEVMLIGAEGKIRGVWANYDQ